MGFNCSSNPTPDSGIMRMGRGGLPSYSKSMIEEDKSPISSTAFSTSPSNATLNAFTGSSSKDKKDKKSSSVSKATLNSFTGSPSSSSNYENEAGITSNFSFNPTSNNTPSEFGGDPRVNLMPVGMTNMGSTTNNDSSSKSNDQKIKSSSASNDQKIKSSSAPETNERTFFNRMTDLDGDNKISFWETMAMMSGISPFIGAATYGYDALKNSGLGGFRTSDQSEKPPSTYGGAVDPTSTEYQELVKQQEEYLAMKKAENDGKDGLYNLFGLQTAEDQAANILRGQQAIERSKNKKDKKRTGIEAVAEEVSDDTMINPETGEEMTMGSQYIRNPLSLEEWLASQGYTMADYGINTGAYPYFIEKPNTYMAHGGPANLRYMSKGGPTMFAWTDEAKAFINDLIDNKGYTAQEANDHIWEVMPRSFINKYERKSMGGLPRQPSGEVEGPGGPKDDLVGPILLSSQEYVMPIEQVKMAGGGNYQTGINRLEKDRKYALNNYS